MIAEYMKKKKDNNTENIIWLNVIKIKYQDEQKKKTQTEAQQHIRTFKKVGKSNMWAYLFLTLYQHSRAQYVCEIFDILSFFYLCGYTSNADVLWGFFGHLFILHYLVEVFGSLCVIIWLFGHWQPNHAHWVSNSSMIWWPSYLMKETNRLFEKKILNFQKMISIFLEICIV